MPLRTCALVAGFTLIALAVVCLRSAQARTAARTLALETRWVELRRELWSVQCGVARLRAPARLYDSLNLFKADLLTRDVRKQTGTGTHLAGIPRD